MRRKYIAPLILLCVGIMLYLYFVYSENRSNSTMYSQATRECPTELWLIYEDIGPTIGTQMKPPYPTDHRTTVGAKKIFGYGCTLDDAAKKQNQL